MNHDLGGSDADALDAGGPAARNGMDEASVDRAGARHHALARLDNSIKLLSRYGKDAMSSMRWKSAILVGFVVACAQETPPSSDSEMMARRVAELVVSGNQNSLAAEFYYPERSSREREADRKGVEALLDVVFDDYGTVAEMTRLDAVPPSMFTMVASGDVKFFNAHPFFTRYPYRVRFSKRGEGYIFVDIMHLNQRAVLRSVSFALPSKRPGTAALIECTSKRMLAVLNKTPAGR